MRPKGALVYFTVFLLLAVFYYFYEHKGGQKREQQEELEKKALVFSLDSVQGFRVVTRPDRTAPADTVALSRDERGRWRLTFPIAAEADSQAVEDLLSSASDASRHRVVEDSAADLAIFGLDEPQLVLELTTGSEPPRTLQLMLGNKNPTGSYVYAANSERPGQVVLLNNWLVSDLKKTPLELRDKKVLRFIKENVSGIVVRSSAHQSLRLEKKDGLWNLTEPLEAPADRDSVQALLAALKEAEAGGFIDDEAQIDLEKFGLSKGSQYLRLELIEGQGQSVRLLHIGRQQEGDSHYYARREGRQNVCLVEDELVQSITRGPSHLRDRCLVSTPKDAIIRLELTTPEESFQALKPAEGAWTLVAASGDTVRADRGKVDALLWDLKDIRVIDFIPHPNRALIMALEEPFLRLEYRTADSSGAAATELVFAQAPGDSLALVRLGGAPELVTVDADKARELAKSSHDLRDKKILGFAVDSIARIMLESEKDTLELAKQEGRWLLVSEEGSPEPIDWKVQNLLWDLAGMEFTRELAGPAGGGSLFHQPVLQVSLWNDDNTGVEPTRQIMFAVPGAPGTDEVYLRRASDGRAFAIKKRIFEGFPKSAGDLIKEE